jgi:hypothetical protein
MKTTKAGKITGFASGIGRFGFLWFALGVHSGQAASEVKGDKDEKASVLMAAENLTPQDDYGRVVDQDGNPVSGADVKGSVLLNTSFATSSTEVHLTTTDANGVFEFVGLKGVNLGIAITKDGYLGSPSGFRKPKGGDQSTPNDRETFVLWKLQGAEAAVHRQVFAKIASDNTPVAVDFTSGQIGTKSGDMVVRFSRSPPGNVPGAQYDWVMTLSIPNGGLTEIRDPYPYKAPESGYIETVSIKPAPNVRNNAFVKRFYYKTASGRFGRLTVDLSPNLPSPLGFRIDSFLNPSGSHNLEYDVTKDPYAPQLLH